MPTASDYSLVDKSLSSRNLEGSQAIGDPYVLDLKLAATLNLDTALHSPVRGIIISLGSCVSK